MKPGDLVVHIGATPTAYRVRMVCHIMTQSAKSSANRLIADRDIITFSDGTIHLAEDWVVWNGWNKTKNR